MGVGFIAAMRGTVLNGGKPMQDFVQILQRQDKLHSTSQQLAEGGFRADWITARRIVCQDAKRRTEQAKAELGSGLANTLLPTLGQPLTWRAAGDHICALAKQYMRVNPNTSPEDALRYMVKDIISRDRQARDLRPVLS